MKVEQRPFGTLSDGTAVTAWTVENAGGAAVTVLDYGATIQALRVPDRTGALVDTVLGYDSAQEYETSGGYLGATIGRVGNRIGGAAFSLNGKTYVLAKNDGENHLHGGIRGFDKQLWTAAPVEDGIVFSLVSPDGQEGYPGTLTVQVAFRLTEDNTLRICYDGDTDQDTPVNLTNHSYFNLNGGGTVLSHWLRLNGERYCENDSGCLPTGKLLDVAGTAFDFRAGKPIGQDIGAPEEQLHRGGGYDHNYVLSGKRAAVLWSPENGIELTVETDLPGMQLYSANSLTPRTGKGGREMGPRDAVCLETQLFPNGMGCYGFPWPVLRKGEHLHTETSYAFRCRTEAFS